MVEAITLELPEDVVRQARETAQRTGRGMTDILTDWLRRGALSDMSHHPTPDSTYPIYTSYGHEALAQGLLEALLAEASPVHLDEPTR